MSATTAFAPQRGISLNAEEQKQFGQWFKQCDPEGLGVVTGDVARTLFERSGLPPGILGEIWQLADTENNGFLDQVGFSLALRLIGHAQTGQQPSLNLGEHAGPLPIFDGRARPDPSKTVSPVVAPVPRVPSQTGGARVPALTPADLQRFSGLFQKVAPSGILDGEQARGIFLKARLPNETLGQIWTLADTQSRGQLNQTEFIVAMHLVQCTLNGSLAQLPLSLPAGLYDAAAGRPSSRSSFRAGSGSLASPRLASQQSLQQQFSGSGRASPSIWAVSPQERTRFDALFDTLDKNKTGIIGDDAVVPFLTTSKLPEDTLAQIWDLADIQNSGQFSKTEFAVAMYLVQQKLAGRELPASLPHSLIASVAGPPAHPPAPASRQVSYANSSPVYQPNPVFLAQDHRPAPQPPQPKPQPQRAASSALNDLVDLNDVFATPSPSLSQPLSRQATDIAPAPISRQPTDLAQQPPLSRQGTDIAPAPISRQGTDLNQSRQFVPSSQFGQALARADTGLGSSSATPQQVPSTTGAPASFSAPTSAPAPAPAPTAATANRDLFVDNDPEVNNKLSTATTEFANLSNQITSLTTQTKGLSEKRVAAETELARLLSAKKDIETRLASLRVTYDAEAKKVHQVQDLLTKSKQETAQASQDYSVVEASLHALQSQYQQLSAELASDQQENATLKEKLRVANEESASLQKELERIQKEARQLKSVNAVSQQQVSVTSKEHETLKADIEAAQAELEREKAAEAELERTKAAQAEFERTRPAAPEPVPAPRSIDSPVPITAPTSGNFSTPISTTTAAAGAGLATFAGIGAAIRSHQDTPSSTIVEPSSSNYGSAPSSEASFARSTSDFGTSVSDGPGLQSVSGTRSPGNPFSSISTSQPTAPTGVFSSAGGQTFEDSFRQMDIASPLTAGPASTNNTEDTHGTPDSSPPSDFHVYQSSETGNIGIPSFTLPLARPASATSSVQNNPPLSVRDDLDNSRPESPVEATTHPVSGMVPPESLELSEHQEESNDYLPDEQDFGGASTTTLAQTAVPEVSRELPDDTEESAADRALDQRSTESFEFVDAEDSSEPLSVGVPGGFPAPVTSEPVDEEVAQPAPTSEPTEHVAPEANRASEEFPPIRELDQDDDESSSDEETPRNIAEPSSSYLASASDHDNFVTPESTGEPEMVFGGAAAGASRDLSTVTEGGEASAPTQPPSGQTPFDSAFQTSGFPFAGTQSAPQSAPFQPSESAQTEEYGEPPEYTPATQTRAPEPDFEFGQPATGSTSAAPAPGASDDPFDSAFVGLSEARTDTGADGVQQPVASFDDFNKVFDSAFPTSAPASNPGQAATSLPGNDEWEQLFAGFSTNVPSASTSNAVGGSTDVNEAFSVAKSAAPGPQAPAAVPARTVKAPTPVLTPHSSAIAELVGMGFSESDAVDALKKKNYNVAEASNYLLDR